MIGGLGARLRNAMRSFVSKGKVDEAALSELVRELQRVLIASDVNVRLVAELSRQIKERALNEKPLPGLTLREHVLRVIYDELVRLVGEGKELGQLSACFVLLGLFGSGKTTTAAKLGYWLKKRGVTPTLVSLDRDRPAAFEQLRQLGESLGLKVSREISPRPCIIDTAGRDALSEDMLREARELVKKVQPEEVFLVLPAEMGHEAGKQAEALKELITGVIITRMDGSAKGGGALSACAAAGVPIVFIGTGERIDELELFDPKRYVSRLLGWGDIQGLLEKAEEIKGEVGELSMADLENLNMLTFYRQMEALTKLGPFEKILQMVGLTDLDRGTVEEMKAKLKKYRVIINSMTRKEQLDPGILNSSRIKRIARGSGTSERDVKALLKEFNMMKKMVRKLKKGRLKGLNPKMLRGLKL